MGLGERAGALRRGHDGRRQPLGPARVAPRSAYGWQRFTRSWTPGTVGEHVLVCRATTGSGATQPATPRSDRVHLRIVFVDQGRSR
ncbi:hypothetical protein AV521_34965 [Streptomyces sp. IMTB 2501]|uniref:hypothetical protein n=1 Tax=Streptomyces sp. IMTB 2501 TaxID=1776340 RepID=UPI00096C4F1D|nr:hypothetical protein [Streptomyces sp. IMTB 2501]OLZ64533.1 hypothetical protein AV521_34965 [Streptomyces sp. IMTB 2501]